MLHYRGLFALPHGAFWVVLYFCRDEFETRTIRLLMLAWLVGLVVVMFLPGLRFLFSAAVAVTDIVMLVLVFGEEARRI